MRKGVAVEVAIGLKFLSFGRRIGHIEGLVVFDGLAILNHPASRLGLGQRSDVALTKQRQQTDKDLRRGHRIAHGGMPFGVFDAEPGADRFQTVVGQGRRHGERQGPNVQSPVGGPSLLCGGSLAGQDMQIKGDRVADNDPLTDKGFEIGERFA